MGITSASPIEDIAREYITCASFDLTGGSVAMAERFVIACRALQLRRPTSVTVDNNPVAFDHAAINRELNRALTWIASRKAATSGGSGARTYDMSGVRNRW
jgi:hypothetical protein